MEKIWKLIIFTFLEILFILSPVILSTIALLNYSQNNDGLFYNLINRLSHINGNYYTVNNVLLTYIIAAYLTIFTGLLTYFYGMFNDVYQYKGDNKAVGRLNMFGHLLLGVVLLLFAFYIVILILSCTEFISISDKIANLHNLVLVNKFFSLVVFFIFLLSDLVSWRSNLIQRKENLRTLGRGRTNEKAKRNIGHNNNEIAFAKDATFFIDIPVFILSLLSVLFTEYMIGAEKFRSIVDQHLNYIKVPLNKDLFELFQNGLETGLITASIIFSQLIFIFLRIRWKWRGFHLDLI